MSARRHTEKPPLDPSAVMALAADHPAMVENRTLFPTTVVTADEDNEDRLLVSGHNSRKLGKTVEKGQFKGYALYSLTLEERATCPPDCSVRSFCYGNGMQLARRNRIEDLDFFALAIEDEIREILSGNKTGLMVRLHVLGDFPSVEYVALWADLLDDHPKLAVFGYTHWMPWPKATDGGAIGRAIQGLKKRFPDRVRIRWSGLHGDDGATVTDKMPIGPKVGDAIVCPAQVDSSACCATCALCWETTKPIAFIKHGRSSVTAAAEVAIADRIPAANGTRAIVPIVLPSKLAPGEIAGDAPELRLVYPTELRVEPTYQRDLSGKSMSLIRKIVAEWDWRKFKPPVCAETAEGLFIVDGQHTAIAAASHPKVGKIPVMVTSGSELEDRAGAFVAHNRDRVSMTMFQLIHAEFVAGGKTAATIFRIVEGSGAFIPRNMPSRTSARAGEVVAISAIRAVLKTRGEEALRRVIEVAVAAGCAPITATVIRSIDMLFSAPVFAELSALPDARIAAALKSIEKFEDSARRHSSLTGWGIYRAGVKLIEAAL